MKNYGSNTVTKWYYEIAVTLNILLTSCGDLFYLTFLKSDEEYH